MNYSAINISSVNISSIFDSAGANMEADISTVFGIAASVIGFFGTLLNLSIIYMYFKIHRKKRKTR